MAQIAAALAPVPSIAPAENKPSAKQTRLEQWKEMLVAELLSALEHVAQIDRDPLLNCW